MPVEHSPFCASEQTTFGSITGAIALPCDCGVLAAATPISIPEPEPEPAPEGVMAPGATGAVVLSYPDGRSIEVVAPPAPSLAQVLAEDAKGTKTIEVVAPPAPLQDPFAANPADTPAEAQIKEAVRTDQLSARIGAGLLLKPLGSPELSKTSEIPVDSTSPLDSILDTESTPAPATAAPVPAPEAKKKRAPRKKKEPAAETPPAVPTKPEEAPAPPAEPPKKEADLFDAVEEAAGEIAKLPPTTEKEGRENHGHVGFPVAPQKLEALYVGIDIGLQGYITEIGPDGQIVAFHPMPTSGGEKPVYDEPGIARILAGLPLKAKRVHVMLEQQQTIGKLFRDGKEVRIGSKAHFKKGMGYGILRGVLATVQRFFPTALSYDEVSAKTWKKAMGISGGSPDDVKKKAITKTGGLYPGLDLRAIERAPKSRVPSGDKAESVLISRYVWLMTTGALKLLARGGEPTEDELAAREKLIEEEAEAANQDPSSASDSPPNTDEGNAKWLASMTRLMTTTGGGRGASAPMKPARNTMRPKPPKATAKPKRKKSDPGTEGPQDLLSGI